MVLDLVVSFSRQFILPLPAFTFIEYLSLFMCWVTRSPISFLRKPTFSLVITSVPMETFLLPLTLLVRFNYVSSLAAQTFFLFFLCYLSLPSPFRGYPFVFEFAQEQLVHPCRPLGIYARFLLGRDALLLSQEDMILEFYPAFLSPSSLQGFKPTEFYQGDP